MWKNLSSKQIGELKDSNRLKAWEVSHQHTSNWKETELRILFIKRIIPYAYVELIIAILESKRWIIRENTEACTLSYSIFPQWHWLAMDFWEAETSLIIIRWLTLSNSDVIQALWWAQSIIVASMTWISMKVIDMENDVHQQNATWWTPHLHQLSSSSSCCCLLHHLDWAIILIMANTR